MPPEADPQATPAPEPTPTPAPESTPAPAPVPVPEPEARMVPAARFDSVVGEKYDLQRQLQSAQAQIAELSATPAPELTPAPTPTPTPAPTAAPAPVPAAKFTQAELDELSRQNAVMIDFNRRCNESVEQGKAAYTDFDETISALTRIAPASDEHGRPMLPIQFVEAALETGMGHDVLYMLGKDTDEADRIMSLTPTKQAVELTKFAERIAKEGDGTGAEQPGLAEQVQKVRASNAPAPIKPRVGKGSGASPKEYGVLDTDKDGKLALSTEEWMTKRQQEVDSKPGRR